MKLVSINPSNNEILGEVEISTQVEITAKVKLAQDAKKGWRDLGIEGRNKILSEFYDQLEKHAEELIKLESEEMGMPIVEAKEDVEGGISYLHWYSDNASKYLSPEVTFESKTEIHQVYREPRGVVGAITPWNFPMSNFVWECGQNLVAGNTIVLKTSEEVPLFTKKIEAIVNQSPLPKGVLNFVYGDGKVGDILVHEDIDMICFTGSTKVGKYLYSVAAEKFIPALLEMGGSAPGIVMEDADLPSVIDSIMLNRFVNCGQVCDGLKRLIVHESRYAELVELLTEKIKSRKIGIATEELTELGPLVSDRILKILEEQVEEARSSGAEIIVGGKRPSGMVGAYYEPTLITNVTKKMRVWSEETFGPVLPVMTFTSLEEAIDNIKDAAEIVIASSKEIKNKIIELD